MQRYGSWHIAYTAKGIYNVVTDDATGGVDIVQGSDNAVAETWNNLWNDGKDEGTGYN